MGKTLNIGMVGYNFMGKAHSNAWRQVDKFFSPKARPVLKTICGRNREKVAAAADKLGWQGMPEVHASGTSLMIRGLAADRLVDPVMLSPMAEF